MRWTALLLVLLGIAALGSTAKPRTPKPASNTTALPVTTSVPSARQKFESAMVALEQLRRGESLDELRAAVKHDPKFAQAWILISHLTHDPDEQASARARAEQLAPRVTPGERMLIRWLAGVEEGNYIPAISAMNDLLAKYPKDHRLAFLGAAVAAG